MLFNSYSFLFLFLPITFVLFFLFQLSHKRSETILFLFLTSIVFYGYWNFYYLPLLLISILFNFLISLLMEKVNRRFFYAGLIGNLSLLIYFKYSQFLLANFYLLLNQPLELINGDLPLGISFFTFTQIAYLTDCYRKQIKVPHFINYGLFVTFFPHLMAGPILHHQEIMPQFENRRKKLLSWENCAVGMTIFSIGLFKKTIIADSLAPYANTVFSVASKEPVTFIEAWCGSISYTFQLYFDFSGYSDMAIGLARLFGIVFPLNFNSPYKARNIIIFWRRWHMTLSRFLRDYIYIPLGGNRKDNINRYVNLMITMIIGGIWHGAGWTFIIWGLLHGFYLVINHLWLQLKKHYFQFFPTKKFIGNFFAQIITFLAVMIAWIFFRAETFMASSHILTALFKNISLSSSVFNFGQLQRLFALLFITGLIIFLGPNTQQLLYRYNPALETYPGEIEPYHIKKLYWAPNAFTAAVCAILTLLSLLSLGHISEFLYYKF
ncbi:MBOAT family O-acyltransferase [Legionella pneumophila]|uniref:Probable alginate O-acetylase n=1 Tax=Legionella pneumophila subsp. pascullei TaxID=91890 RepID=A0AAX2IXZ5_LEGPN|nr:MBOAT family O-acyltransferase [Legionella pneumophila]SQG89629.1 alginate O-acetylation protein [Legionella pneumophila subsp. pascullei]VEH05090.1 alginate O-acetylation protein [Legionella pneumophila subsp. pascullei]HAU3861356.1 MBOAT family protein [Legionella pneumophila]HDU8260092.1 MBOAT family protein [Legionella pneumophila]